jgi:hypothetical protein
MGGTRQVKVVEAETATRLQMRPATVTVTVGGGVGRTLVDTVGGGYAVRKFVPVIVISCPPVKIVEGLIEVIVGMAINPPVLRFEELR